MRIVTSLTVLALLISAPAALAAGSDARYGLANDCWTLQSGTVSDGPFFLKPTDLGSYMFYDKNKAFLSADSNGGLTRASDGGPLGDWTVQDTRAGSRCCCPHRRRRSARRAASSPWWRPVQPASSSSTRQAAARSSRRPTTEATGTPARGKYAFSDVRGLVDAHMHMMAFEFLGGSAHCGKPWDRYGVTVALVDCPDHHPGARRAVLETAFGGKPLTTTRSAGRRSRTGRPTTR